MTKCSNQELKCSGCAEVTCSFFLYRSCFKRINVFFFLTLNFKIIERVGRSCQNVNKFRLSNIYSRLREERPIFSCSYFNRRCHNDLPSRNLALKICVSLRKIDFKHIFFVSVLYMIALRFRSISL